MLFDGISLIEGSELQNLTVDSGSTYPSPPEEGMLFYRNDGANEGLYVYNGSAWTQLQAATGAVAKAGDTMTGLLILSADPAAALGAATKQYVDNKTYAFSTLTSKPTTLSGYGITDGQPLSVDLTAIAGLTAMGIIARTATGTAATRTITGTAGRIDVTNGTGSAGHPTIDLVSGIATASTYTSVTVDTYGRVTAGTNPTTLTGYGITDGQPLSADLTAIDALSGTAGLLRKTATDTWTLDTVAYAPLASPALTGTPIAPTATPGTNSTQISTTAYTDAAVTAATSAIQAGNVATATAWQTPRDLSLTGDGAATLSSVNGTSNVSTSLTLATVNSGPGSYGSASAVPVVTVNGKGLVTSSSSTPIDIATSQVTSGTFADARIAASNVTQHQASLTIAESQITNGTLLARVADTETISGSWSFATAATSVDPTGATHLATKQYVDNLATGLDFKYSVRAATTANITLSGTQTIDGVAVIAGDRILVKNQSTGSENGIYVADAGAWSRSTDADNSVAGEVTAGLYCFVEEGTAASDTGWVLTTDNPIILGTTALTFVQFTGLGQITAGNGLTKVGSTISAITANSAQIVVGVSGIDLATAGTAGTYSSVTTDAYGRVTAGSNIGVTGDVSGTVASGALTLTLATVNSNTGSFGSTSVVPVITVNGKGLVTAVSTATITPSSISAVAKTGDTMSGTLILAAGTTSVAPLKFQAGVLQSSATANTVEWDGSLLYITTNAVARKTIAYTDSTITGNAANVTGIVAVANGGTGAATLTGYVKGSGTSTMTASSTIPGSDISGSVAVVNGGTGATDAATALTNLGAVAKAGDTMSGTLTFSSGYVIKSTGTGISAAGTTQGTGTALTKQINLISTAAAGTGVVLPTAAAGLTIIVINGGANALNVYPASGGTIGHGGTLNAALAQPVGSTLTYVATSATQWYPMNASYA